jgi:small subunit ribosomal protein S4
VVFRANFAESRAQARQLVSHAHFLVNGRKVDVPSYRLRKGDEVTLRDRSRDLLVIQHALDTAGSRNLPEWLEVDTSEKKIVIHELPNRAQIDTQVQEQLIVELYSK